MPSDLAKALRRDHRLVRFAFVVVALSVIGISVLPGRYLPDIGLWDKLEHVIAYAVLAIAGCVAFRGARNAMWLAFSLPALGAALEVCQLFMPGRSAEVGDAIANTVGVGLVILPVFIFQMARRS